MIRINWGASPPMARYCFLMGEHDVARAASERALRLATDHQDFALQVTAQMYLGQIMPWVSIHVPWKCLGRTSSR